MPDKEASARIKINKLLEAAGWRFFQDGDAPANIRLEPSLTIKSTDLDALGDNFEKISKGLVDFLLLDAKGFPLLVLEAKAEDKNPLVAKEQARKYAKSQNCRFVILSNGDLHYFWDLERGNPHVITSFPTPDSVTGYRKITPNPERLIDEQVGEDYIVRTQRPNYQSEAGWRNEEERPGYIQANKLRFLRSGNVRRVLFLVDRLELEDQAKKAFVAVLSADFQTVSYKENRDDWKRAEIVVTTVQSLLFNNKYLRLFSPTDFEGADILSMVEEETIGHAGMKIDRMFFEKFEDVIRANDTVASAIEAGQWDRVIDYVNREVFDKPEEAGAIPAIKTYFKAYVTSDVVRGIIESKQFTDLATNPVFSTRDFRAVLEKYRVLVPEYVKDYVPLNQFAA